MKILILIHVTWLAKECERVGWFQMDHTCLSAETNWKINMSLLALKITSICSLGFCNFHRLFNSVWKKTKNICLLVDLNPSKDGGGRRRRRRSSSSSSKGYSTGSCCCLFACHFFHFMPAELWGWYRIEL